MLGNTKILIFIFLGLLFLGIKSEAQISDELEEATVLLKKQFSGNVFLHNLGWGFGARYGAFKNVKLDRIYEFDFAKYKHPKEVKIVNPAYNRPPSYVYGKLNELFFLRFGIGNERLLYRKGEKNGIEIRYHLSGGLNAALLKPVYLLILPTDQNQNPTPLKYNPDEHFNSEIFGVADFSYGLDELKLRPGGYAKFALMFEWSEYDEDLRSLEAGVTIDAFPARLPVMAFIENKHTFVSLYLALSLGKRW